MTEITGTEPTKPTETTNATETTAPGAVELRTPRLILRHWRANDEDDIAAKYEYGRNPKVAEPCIITNRSRIAAHTIPCR